MRMAKGENRGSLSKRLLVSNSVQVRVRPRQPINPGGLGQGSTALTMRDEEEYAELDAKLDLR